MLLNKVMLTFNSGFNLFHIFFHRFFFIIFGCFFLAFYLIKMDAITIFEQKKKNNETHETKQMKNV